MTRSSRMILAAALVATMWAMPALALQRVYDSAGIGGGSEAPFRNHQEADLYERATAAFDRGDYAAAIGLFRQIVQTEGSRADASLYWIAYAYSKNGEAADALAAIGELRSTHPDSRWIDDAEFLEAEIRGAAGQDVEVEPESNDEMRLYALNSLMHANPERAVPLLRRILDGDESDEMKGRALFVLVQNDSEQAFDVVDGVARGENNVELRLTALRHMGMYDSERAHPVMDEIYQSTKDVEIKAAVLAGFMMGGHTERLRQAARTETDPKLHIAAIRYLGMSGGADELWDLYQSESSIEAKKEILRSMGMTGHSSRLVEVLRTESNSELRSAALRGLAMVGDDDEEGAVVVRELLLEIYGDADTELRGQALQALWMRGDASTLIELYGQESDQEMRTRIVRALSMMDSKEAIEFLIQLIEQ